VVFKKLGGKRMNKPKNYPFVEPEMAKLAKEKGFHKLCDAFYQNDETYSRKTYDTQFHRLCDFNSLINIFTSAPTYTAIIDWFREEHKIDISWMPNWEYQGSAELYLDGYEFTIQSIEKYHLEPLNVIRGEFYSALQEAITKAFTLI
jgi:hypothetical protein